MSPAERLATELGAVVADVDGPRIVPMLCERETSMRALERAGYLYELKLDGVRIIADRRGERVSLTYRKSRDATRSYPEIAEAMKTLGEERVVLDGEIVAFDDRGRPDFQRLGTRIQSFGRDARRAMAEVPVVYVVFDVLALGSRDLRRLPIEARKEVLARVLPESSAAGGLLRLQQTFDDGSDLFRICREHRLEGVVAKRHGSIYRSGERSADWIKIKCELDADLVVAGWTEGEGKRSRLGALEVASYEGERLILRGRVGSGLDEAMIEALLPRLRALEVPRALAEGRLTPKLRRHFVRPEIVVSVRHMGFTNDEGYPALRHPVFRGVRADLRPEDCTIAPGAPSGVAMSEERAIREKSRRLHLTSPESPALADGTTRGALAAYLEEVAPRLLAHVAKRPCTLVRLSGQAIWPPPRWMPSWVHTACVRAGEREIRGFVLDSLDALTFAVEAGAASIEHGPFREDAHGVADGVVLRVARSGEGAPADLARAALSVREMVGTLGGPAQVKIAGGAALDVLVPIAPAPTSAADLLAALVAKLVLDAGLPDGVTLEAASTTTAPYAPCRGGGLAIPLEWAELATLDPSAMTFAFAVERVRAGRDGWIDAPRAPLDVAAAARSIESLLATRGERA